MLLMTLFSLIGKSINENLYFLLLIPITGQMLHFYIDSLFGVLVMNTIEM